MLDEEIKSFLMENAEDMQKVLIQEIRDKFVEKVDDKIVWKQGFRVRLKELKDQRNIICNSIYNGISKFNFPIIVDEDSLYETIMGEFS